MSKLSFEQRAVKEYLNMVAELIYNAECLDWMWEENGKGVRIMLPYLGTIGLDCDREKFKRYTAYLQQGSPYHARGKRGTDERPDTPIRIKGFCDGVPKSNRRGGLGKRGESGGSGSLQPDKICCDETQGGVDEGRGDNGQPDC